VPSIPASRGFLPLEVCGRRPRARGAIFMGPASENLHKSGRAKLPGGFFPRRYFSGEQRRGSAASSLCAAKARSKPRSTAAHQRKFIHFRTPKMPFRQSIRSERKVADFSRNVAGKLQLMRRNQISSANNSTDCIWILRSRIWEITK
jgi:hypothetical protein